MNINSLCNIIVDMYEINKNNVQYLQTLIETNVYSISD